MIEYSSSRRVEMGRPQEIKKRRRGMPVSFYMDDYLMEMLEEVHWRERKSVSELARIAIEEYLERHKEGNSSFKLDTWSEDPDFRAVPTILADQEIWKDYLHGCKDKELTDLSIKSIFITEFIKHVRTQIKYKKQ